MDDIRVRQTMYKKVCYHCQKQQNVQKERCEWVNHILCEQCEKKIDLYCQLSINEQDINNVYHCGVRKYFLTDEQVAFLIYQNNFRQFYLEIEIKNFSINIYGWQNFQKLQKKRQQSHYKSKHNILKRYFPDKQQQKQALLEIKSSSSKNENDFVYKVYEMYKLQTKIYQASKRYLDYEKYFDKLEQKKDQCFNCDCIDTNSLLPVRWTNHIVCKSCILSLQVFQTKNTNSIINQYNISYDQLQSFLPVPYKDLVIFQRFQINANPLGLKYYYITELINSGFKKDDS